MGMGSWHQATIAVARYAQGDGSQCSERIPQTEMHSDQEYHLADSLLRTESQEQQLV